MADDMGLSLLFKCPVGGESWPTDLLKASVDSLPRAGKQTLRTVHFWCPAFHSFNLAQALKAGVFTKQQASDILRYAQETYEKQMKAWGLPVRKRQDGGRSRTRGERGIPRAPG